MKKPDTPQEPVTHPLESRVEGGHAPGPIPRTPLIVGLLIGLAMLIIALLMLFSPRFAMNRESTPAPADTRPAPASHSDLHLPAGMLPPRGDSPAPCVISLRVA